MNMCTFPKVALIVAINKYNIIQEMKYLYNDKNE